MTDGGAADGSLRQAPDDTGSAAAGDAEALAQARRLLSGAIILQVLSQVPPIVGRIVASSVAPGGQPGIDAALRGLDDAAWVKVTIDLIILGFLVVAAASFVGRSSVHRPAARKAVTAAIAAQVILIGLQFAPELVALQAAVGAVVIVLTVIAYAALRGARTLDVEAVRPTARDDHSRLRTLAVGVGAILVVVSGNVASASRSSSPVACVDVTKDVGIAFRGALGTAVVDGSDLSVEMQQNMGNGVAVGDYDKDGNLDLYLLGQPGHPNRLFHNDHTAARDGFSDVTDPVGLGGFTGSRAAQFVDLDNDGRLDVVAVNDFQPGTALQPSRIYRNTGASFQDVTAGSGFDPEGVIVGGLGIADYDRDGLPDLYVTYWAGGMELGSTYGSHNRLFRNLGDFHFKEVTQEVGLGTLSTGSFTPVFADLNADGWPDLYVAVDGAPEVLFLNDHGRFRDATAASGLGTVRNGMGAAVVNIDGAVTPSVYVTNITEPEYLLGTLPGGDALLRSSLAAEGTVSYQDDAKATGVRDAGWGWGAVFTDLDLDGNPDLFVAQGMDVATRRVSDALTNDRAHVFLGTAGGAFVRSTDDGCDIPGDQRAVVALDYDRDGAPDLLVSQVLLDFKLLQNRSHPRGHWLTVVTEPTAGHTVVGAKVTVTTGSHRWVQTLIGGGSYLAGPPNEAYFGLGSSVGPITVTVDWPDGTSTSTPDVATDQVVRIAPR